MSKQVKARLLLTTILGLPIIGIAVAYISYHNDIFSAISKTNNGELILPPVSLQQLKLQPLVNDTKLNENNLLVDPTWKLLILGGKGCNDECQQQLYLTRQIHIALGREADRLERIYLFTEERLIDNNIFKAHPKLKVANISKENLDIHIRNNISITQSTILLADPLGNIMMYYTKNHSGKAILKDIKHLLKSSRIG